MGGILDKLDQWLRGLLTEGIKGNLTGMFDSVNTKVGEIVGEVGKTPQGWNGGVFSMIQNLSETVIVPIAGVILTFVMCVELIQMVTERNNLHDIDTWMFFKWVFKTFCAVLIVTNTWNIVMGIFDAAQSVVNSSAGVIIGNTSVDISGVLGNLDAQMEALETGELFGLWFQSIFVGLTMNILSICIMLVIYGRMIEVYLTASVGPIPLATMTNRDWGHTGQNYLRSLFALGFQAFLIMVCVGIYSVLVQNIGVGSNVSAAIWACMGYTVLLCFALFKTGRGDLLAYVTIPKDLTKVKSKVLFGLTRRQLICFGAAVLVGVPLFFLLKNRVASSAAALCMILVMLPFFLLAMYEKHGQPLEVILGQMIQAMFVRPKLRPYATNNFYAAVARQIQVEQEVRAVVQKRRKIRKKAKADRR